MSDSHPVESLYIQLKEARTSAVEVLAAKGFKTVADLQELTTIQTALDAVGQTIREHSGGVGWAGDEKKLEKAAVTLRDE